MHIREAALGSGYIVPGQDGPPDVDRELAVVEVCLSGRVPLSGVLDPGHDM